jgi:hypothetical protein
VDREAGGPVLDSVQLDGDGLDLFVLVLLVVFFVFLLTLFLLLRFLLRLFQKGEVLLGEPESVEGLLGEEEPVDVRLSGACPSRAPEPVTVRLPHHHGAARRPLWCAVGKAALGEVHDLAGAV